MKIQIVTLSYNVEGKGRGGASGPAALLRAGLVRRLEEQGHIVPDPLDVGLAPDEERQYGGWNRVALAGGRLADLVQRARADGSFILGLLADCNGLLGVLGGLQGGAAARTGLVYVDAHGDYNTPDTSLSGMLGGMPVAVAAGKCLPRLRVRNKMEMPLEREDIFLMGLRDLDALERDALSEDGIHTLSEQDLVRNGATLREAMGVLSAGVETIYVHVDLDILDPGVAPAAGLPSPGGLTGEQLGLALKTVLGYPKVAALSVVSYRADRDQDGGTLREVVQAILLATSGPAL